MSALILGYCFQVWLMWSGGKEEVHAKHPPTHPFPQAGPGNALHAAHPHRGARLFCLCPAAGRRRLASAAWWTGEGVAGWKPGVVRAGWVMGRTVQDAC